MHKNPSIHKIYTINKKIYNGEVSILGMEELNSYLSKVKLKYNLYHWTYGWYKTRRINIVHNKNTVGYGPFKS